MTGSPPGSPPDHEKHVADLQAVIEVTRELAVTDSLEDLAKAVERAACQVLECQQATLLLTNRERGARERSALVRPASAGDDGHAVQTELALAAAGSGRPIELDEPAADPRFDAGADGCCGVDTRNLAFFPLLDDSRQVVGVLQVRNMPPPDPWDDELIKIFDSQVGVAVQRHLLLEHYAEKQRIERDLKLARTIQQGLLPAGNPRVEGFDVAGWNQPADDTGGDFWDHHRLPGGVLALALADATGHGIGPALMMAACRALFRATAASSRDLTEMVDRINRLLYEDLTESRSITAVLALLEGDTLSYLSAGQGPLVSYSAATGKLRCQNAHGIPLGILPDYPWPEAEHLTMASGDVMMFVTDGFFEWESAGGEEFGIPRMLGVLEASHGQPAEEIIRDLYRAVKEFVGDVPQNDDLTAVVVRKP